MFFPYIKEIASTDLTKIPMEHTIGQAIQRMIETQHRSLIVEDGYFYYILLAQDILTLNHAELDLNLPVSKAVLHRLPKIDQEKNILEAISYLQESVEYIASVDTKGTMVGLVSHSDIIDCTDPEILIENYSIGEIVKSQKNDIWVKPEESTDAVLHKMKVAQKDCAIIIQDGKPIGIFTIKDVLALYRDKKTVFKPISDYMTQPVKAIEASFSIKQALEFIKSKPFKRLVVINSEHKMVGMIMQKELISLAYNSWSTLMKQHQTELYRLNGLLSEQADRYKHLAAFDPLTNLYNRYKFIELYTTEFIAMGQRNRAMSLIMLDIDYFKKINDQYGHNVGDDVLREVAQILPLSVRNIDIVCRWGGEEFILLLPTVTKEKAGVIAEKIGHIISEMAFTEGFKITASLGVTDVRDNDVLEEVIYRADTALYQAKRQGRNRTVIFNE